MIGAVYCPKETGGPRRYSCRKRGCKRGSPQAEGRARGSSCRGGNAHTGKTRLQRLVSRLSESLGRLFGKLQNIAIGRSTVLDYVMPEAQAVVDDLNELDNEEYELQSKNSNRSNSLTCWNLLNGCLFTRTKIGLQDFFDIIFVSCVSFVHLIANPRIVISDCLNKRSQYLFYSTMFCSYG